MGFELRKGVEGTELFERFWRAAIDAALMAPADVPHRIGKGLRRGSGNSSRIALSTPA
jgi:hypothetical protein